MAKQTKPKMGRPAIEPSEKRDKPAKAMVTASELEELQAAATAQQRTVSDWLRIVALEAARGHG